VRAFGRKLYMARKGSGSDQRIYWSRFDGSSWTSQANVTGVGPTQAAIAELAVMVYSLTGCPGRPA